MILAGIEFFESGLVPSGMAVGYWRGEVFWSGALSDIASAPLRICSFAVSLGTLEELAAAMESENLFASRSPIEGEVAE